MVGLEIILLCKCLLNENRGWKIVLLANIALSCTIINRFYLKVSNLILISYRHYEQIKIVFVINEIGIKPWPQSFYLDKE